MANAERIAFVCPRFAEGATVGGAETLMKYLALRASAAGRTVTFLTTCASNHFTWANELPPGPRQIGGMEVIFFPVDEDRDIQTFLRIQDIIVRGGRFTEEDESSWFKNNVNSTPLYDHLRNHGNDYDRIVMGPYLFALVYFAARINPSKTTLVPCLHDESFAYLTSFREMFRSAGSIMFNSEPELDLACRLFDLERDKLAVVGMGIQPPAVMPEKDAFAKRHNFPHPYVLYSGRREGLKGTPLLIDYLTAFRARTGKDIKLVLTGKGTVDLPSELRAHVLDVGLVSEEEKYEAMAGAVAFCHPSVNESFGIVILEAWLTETPCLVHAKSEVLRYQCQRSNGGLWFRTYPEFEEEMNLLLDNEKARKALGEAGRTYVLENYSPEAVDKKLFEALDGPCQSV